MTTTTIATIPLSKLYPGDKATGGSINARRKPADVDAKVRSIMAHGLLMPLLVRTIGGDIAKGADIVEGNTRRLALLKIQKEQKGADIVTLDHNRKMDLRAIRCLVIEGGVDALEVSMVLNTEREALHPADQFEVFADLVAGGVEVGEIARRYGLKLGAARQVLALGRMSPAVRQAWRDGKIGAEAAEAFTITTDHKAQDAALKKTGKHGSAWNVRQALAGNNEHRIDSMLKFVGRAAYESAGYEINASLFSGRPGQDDDAEGPEIVSDAPALVAMVAAKLEAKCDELKAAGWKWATTEASAPKDWRSWKRLQGGSATKAQMATAGVVISLDYTGKIEQQRGIIKPGDKAIAQPKSPKEKKAAQKKRAVEMAETGGITNMLAWRLSQQLTKAVQTAMPANIGWDDAVALTIAVLACANDATPHLRIRGDADDGGRYNNDFAKYLKLAQGKTQHERCDLLMTWLAKAVDLIVHDGRRLNGLLHPGKSDTTDVKLLVSLIDEKAYLAAARKHFDAKDYFASVSKTMIVEAVTEALGQQHGRTVSAMKSAAAIKFAIANVPDTWLPLALRPGK